MPEPDPTTTTTLPPDTTTTTVPEPDPTTTTTLPAPGMTATTPPPDPTTTTDPRTETPPLDPGETLECHPEFAALTGHQRGLVQELQTATDSYALRRFALVELTRQVAAAKDALWVARAAEIAAIERELSGLTQAMLDRDDVTAKSDDDELDDWVAGFRAVKRPLQSDSRDARLVRVQAKATVAAANARVAEQAKLVAEASDARVAAEAAIEDALGPAAVRARPDGITATLTRAQADQPDPFVIGGIGQTIIGGSLSSPFGVRNDPLCGGAGFHAGLDLAAAAGTPIHAAAGGVVVTAGDCGGYGNCVVIDHGASLASVYGHQSQVLVHVGDAVDTGQVIGLVGSTGRSTGPHLHFEVRLHGLAIDPLLALTA